MVNKLNYKEKPKSSFENEYFLSFRSKSPKRQPLNKVNNNDT